MKVTNTKVETTLFDSNGKPVKVIKKEIVEVDTNPHLLNREESKELKHQVHTYKNDLQEAKKVKEQLEKAQGCKKGGKIFRDMADLIMIVKPRNETTHRVEIVTNLKSTMGESLWASANLIVTEFQNPVSKKSKKKK
jgi:hypothetical protein